MESQNILVVPSVELRRDYHKGCYSSVSYVDNKDEFKVELYAPGFKEQDFNLQIADQMLSIYAEQRGTGNCFRRNIKLPDTIDVASNSLYYKHGSFKVTFHKNA